MNKTEARYAAILEARKRAGEIRDYAFEAVTLRLADGVRYLPDFVVHHLDDRMELVEVKGAYVREDARIKFRVARQEWPGFVWTWAQWARGAWTIESAA